MNEPQPPPFSATPPKNGLSVTSLILGILSLAACSILTGIPAIITGHIAKSRAKQQPQLYTGAGMALAGLIMGYVSIAMAVLILPIMAALLLPALAKAKGKAQTIQCVNNMKQVALAARIWANDHNDTYPPDILTMSNELNSPKILTCPDDRSKTRAMDWADFSASENLSYEFLTPGAKEADILSQTAFRCPIHENIALGDGSVQQGRRRR
jgi:hypothetical protein